MRPQKSRYTVKKYFQIALHKSDYAQMVLNGDN